MERATSSHQQNNLWQQKNVIIQYNLKTVIFEI